MFAEKGKDPLSPPRRQTFLFHNIFTITGAFGEKEVDSITFYWYNRPNEIRVPDGTRRFP